MMNKQICRMLVTVTAASLLFLISSCRDEARNTPTAKVQPVLAIRELPPKVLVKEKEKKEGTPLGQKLCQLILPHIEVEEMPVDQFVKQLTKDLRQLDPDGIGVNIFLKLSNRTRPGMMAGDNTVPTVTMVVDDIPAIGAIRYMCLASNLKYRVEDDAVVICSDNVLLDPLETRIYPLESEAIDTLGGGDDSDLIRQYFERRSVPFPDGASIVYDSRISRLIVTNTPENLALVEDIVDELNVVDPQVLVETKYLRIPEDTFRRLRQEYRRRSPDKPFWREIACSPETEVIASSSVTAMNGQEATIRSVVERYDPEEWGELTILEETNNEEPDDDDGGEDKPNGEDKRKSPTQTEPVNGMPVQQLSTPSPLFGDPIELGLIWRTTPNVDADHYTITLESNPVYQQQIGWTEYYRANGMQVKMPLLKSWTNETSMTIYDRETLVLSSDVIETSHDGKSKPVRMRYAMLLTASLVNPDGTCIRHKPFDRLVVDTREAERHESTTRQEKSVPVEPKGKKRKVGELIIDKLVVDEVLPAELVSALNKAIRTNRSTTGGQEVVLEAGPAALTALGRMSMDFRRIPIANVIRYFTAGTDLKVETSDRKIRIHSEKLEFRDHPSRHALYYSIGQTVPIPRAELGSSRLAYYYRRRGVALPPGTVLEPHSTTDSQSVNSTGVDYDAVQRSIRNRASFRASDALQRYFEQRGVGFPDGACVGFDRRKACFAMNNTPRNHERFAALLRDIDIQTPLVEIEVQIVEISDEGQAELFLGKDHELFLRNLSVVPAAVLDGILESPHSRLLGAPTVIGTSGTTAIGRMTSMEMYPEAWTEPEVDLKDGRLMMTPAYPEFGDALDLGGRLEVTPTVSPNNYTIALHMSPRLAFFRGWSEFKYESEGGRPQLPSVKMPEIEVLDLDANLKVHDGQTVFVGRLRQLRWPGEKAFGSLPTNSSWHDVIEHAKSKGAEYRNIYIFVTARLVSGDGAYVRGQVTKGDDTYDGGTE